MRHPARRPSALDGCRARQRRRVGVHERERHGHQGEAGGIDQHDRHEAAPGDEDAAEWRTEQAGEARRRGERGVGPRQLRVGDDRVDDGDVRRVVQLCERRLRGHDQVGGPDPVLVDREQREEHDGLTDVGGDEAAAQIDAVDDRAGDRAEQRRRDELADEQDRGRRADRVSTNTKTGSATVRTQSPVSLMNPAVQAIRKLRRRHRAGRRRGRHRRRQVRSAGRHQRTSSSAIR